MQILHHLGGFMSIYGSPCVKICGHIREFIRPNADDRPILLMDLVKPERKPPRDVDTKPWKLGYCPEARAWIVAQAIKKQPRVNLTEEQD